MSRYLKESEANQRGKTNRKEALMKKKGLFLDPRVSYICQSERLRLFLPFQSIPKRTEEKGKTRGRKRNSSPEYTREEKRPLAGNGKTDATRISSTLTSLLQGDGERVLPVAVAHAAVVVHEVRLDRLVDDEGRPHPVLAGRLLDRVVVRAQHDCEAVGRPEERLRRRDGERVAGQPEVGADAAVLDGGAAEDVRWALHHDLCGGGDLGEALDRGAADVLADARLGDGDR